MKDKLRKILSLKVSIFLIFLCIFFITYYSIDRIIIYGFLRNSMDETVTQVKGQSNILASDILAMDFLKIRTVMLRMLRYNRWHMLIQQEYLLLIQII